MMVLVDRDEDENWASMSWPANPRGHYGPLDYVDILLCEIEDCDLRCHERFNSKKPVTEYDGVKTGEFDWSTIAPSLTVIKEWPKEEDGE